MKAATYLFLIFIMLSSCQTRKAFSESNESNSFVDSAILSKIKVIQYKKSKSVVFPAEYTAKFFINDTTLKGFFTPDKEMIDYINENIANTYCELDYEFGKEWRNASDEEIAKKQYKECLKNIRVLEKFDKQFMGYINKDGEQVVICILLDLRKDTDNQKSTLEKSIIYGSGDWFEKNSRCRYFHVKDKRFSINSDG